MIRVRFVAPASGGLLVLGARVALANALFARGHKGHFIARLPVGEGRIAADLSVLGIASDSAGQPGDHTAAVDHLKSIGRLYPCFESEAELRAKRVKELIVRSFASQPTRICFVRFQRWKFDDRHVRLPGSKGGRALRATTSGLILPLPLLASGKCSASPYFNP